MYAPGKAGQWLVRWEGMDLKFLVLVRVGGRDLEGWGYQQERQSAPARRNDDDEQAINEESDAEEAS